MKRILFITAAIFMALLSVSCNKGGIFGGDPEGTITINLRNDVYHTMINDVEVSNEDGTEYSRNELFLGLNSGNNFQPYNELEYTHGRLAPTSTAEIVSLGSVHGLGSISTEKVPAAGWSSKSAAIVGNGYILRYTMKWNDFEANFYYGVYVEDTIVGTDGGILGYKVKYCPFTPGKGWNQ